MQCLQKRNVVMEEENKKSPGTSFRSRTGGFLYERLKQHFNHYSALYTIFTFWRSLSVSDSREINPMAPASLPT